MIYVDAITAYRSPRFGAGRSPGRSFVAPSGPETPMLAEAEHRFAMELTACPRPTARRVTLAVEATRRHNWWHRDRGGLKQGAKEAVLILRRAPCTHHPLQSLSAGLELEIVAGVRVAAALLIAATRFGLCLL